MSQRAVERALGKMITDDGFRHQFFRNPRGACFQAGLELSGEELDALCRVPESALDALGACIDDRICRLCIPDPPVALSPTPSPRGEGSGGFAEEGCR